MWYPRKGTCLGPEKSEGFGEGLEHRVVRASQLGSSTDADKGQGCGWYRLSHPAHDCASIKFPLLCFSTFLLFPGEGYW